MSAKIGYIGCEKRTRLINLNNFFESLHLLIMELAIPVPVWKSCSVCKETRKLKSFISTLRIGTLLELYAGIFFVNLILFNIVDGMLISFDISLVSQYF